LSSPHGVEEKKREEKRREEKRREEKRREEKRREEKTRMNKDCAPEQPVNHSRLLDLLVVGNPGDAQATTEILAIISLLKNDIYLLLFCQRLCLCLSWYCTDTPFAELIKKYSIRIMN
jgi:hypothetical protein